MTIRARSANLREIITPLCPNQGVVAGVRSRFLSIVGRKNRPNGLQGFQRCQLAPFPVAHNNVNRHFFKTEVFAQTVF